MDEDDDNHESSVNYNLKDSNRILKFEREQS